MSLNMCLLQFLPASWAAFFVLTTVANGFVISGNTASTLRIQWRHSRNSVGRPRSSTILSMSSDMELAELAAGGKKPASDGQPVEPQFNSPNKMLHVVYRVGDLDRTIRFYQEVFGMELLRQRDVPDDKYANAFLGYGTESKGQHFSIELTYNYGVDSYDIGDGLAAIGLRLPNIDDVARKAKAAGGEIISGPEEVVLGPSLIPDEPVGKKTVEKVLRLKDPDGWPFEVSEQLDRRDPVSKVSLRTLDMEKSIAFYQDALGMSLVRRRALLPASAAQVARLGYGPEDDNTMVEILYEYAREKVDKGNGYGQVAVSAPNVYDAAAQIEKANYKVTRAPGEVPGIGTKITATLDPDGYKTIVADENDMEAELQD